MTDRFDVVIVGGAVMGSATAYWLLRYDPAIRVAVLDRDMTFARSSTLRCDGNVRIQFNLPENIAISQFAMDFLEDFSQTMAVGDWHPDPSCRRQGNLFLVQRGGEDDARHGLDAQTRLGESVEWLSADEIAAAYPPYTGTTYVAGTLGRRDGSVDPAAVLEGYRRKAASLGARYMEAEVRAVLRNEQAVTGVDIGGDIVSAPVVVNAAGAWCTDLAKTAAITLPVKPIMRSVFVLEADIDSEHLPSAFAPSGLYVLAEPGNTYLVAWSLPNDPVGYDFSVSRQHFDETIWPELVGNFPAFEAVRVVRGWAGLYANNDLDGNGIIGEWPELEGFYLANGFSGHGFQQCHAVGRHLAELILGRPASLDLSRLSPARILRNEPVYEHAGRLI